MEGTTARFGPKKYPSKVPFRIRTGDNTNPKAAVTKGDSEPVSLAVVHSRHLHQTALRSTRTSCIDGRMRPGDAPEHWPTEPNSPMRPRRSDSTVKGDTVLGEEDTEICVSLRTRGCGRC